MIFAVPATDPAIADGSDCAVSTFSGGLLSVHASSVGSAGCDVIVRSTTGGHIRIMMVNDNFVQEITATGSNFVPTWNVEDIEVIGSEKADYIDLSEINSSNWFYSINSVFVNAHHGDDVIIGSSYADRIFGAGGRDYIDGGNGNDYLDGQGSSDVVIGGAGDDRMKGKSGNDTFLGGDGNDTIFGGDGRDTISGGDGDDSLKGEGGRDVLFGDDGDDVLLGGPDTDTLHGGLGNDILEQ